MQPGLIASGRDTKEALLFTALDPAGDKIDEDYEDQTKPRKVHYRNKRKIIFQDSIYWINLGKAQDEGLPFHRVLMQN